MKSMKVERLIIVACEHEFNRNYAPLTHLDLGGVAFVASLSTRSNYIIALILKLYESLIARR